MQNARLEGTEVATTQAATDNEGPAIAYRPRGRTDKPTPRAGRPTKLVTKRPVKLMIDAAVYESMVVHGLRRGENLSELVEGLVRRHLNDFVVHRKAGPKGGEE